MEAAQLFFKQALAVVGHAPERVTTDGHTSYPRAVRETLGDHVLHRTNKYLNNRLVLQRDFTSAILVTGPAVACDESNRRRSCGVADRRSKPRPQAHPARVGAKRPARASTPERR